MYAGSTLSVDGTGTVEIGSSGDATAGSIVVDAGQSLAGAGTISGSLNNTGLVAASGGTFVLAGIVDGTGSLLVHTSSELSTLSAVDSGQTVDFSDATGTLDIGDLAGFQATINDLKPAASCRQSGYD